MNLFACADCGHEQNSMFRACDLCKSPRVVTVQMLENTFGPQWKQFLTEAGELSE